MYNKGFTLVELITTFAVSSAIIILLINLVLVIKDINVDSKIKTDLLVNQGQLSEALNSKIKDNNLLSYTPCYTGSFCYNFNLSDGESITLDVTSNSIKFGNYVYKLPDETIVTEPSIENITLSSATGSGHNSILVIKIPISNKLYPNQNFGVRVIYQYNSNNISL